MEASRKRSLPEDDDFNFNDKPTQKRVRFPKGKKVKPTEGGGDVAGPVAIGAEAAPSTAAPPDLSDPRIAAKERADRRAKIAAKRTQMTTELFNDEETIGMLNDITAAEVNYQDDTDFVDDGIQMEPFNLEQERKEGYFDDNGNFIEYVDENQIKDAWLDSVEVDTRYTVKEYEAEKQEEVTPDLSSDNIGKMKRRIADLLQPEETVLQALRRLKGTSTDRKQKMPEATKVMFDQLTEDSMRLMENGDYNVYHEKREVFQREAEGYERIARAKEGTSVSAENGHSVHDADLGVFSNGIDHGVVPLPLSGPESSVADATGSTANNPYSNAADDFDMFGEDEEPTTNPLTSDNGLGTGSTQEPEPVPSSLDTNLETESAGVGAENDYTYDESSGYYYNTTLGYYYDPASGLYCSANSGIWYSYNEQTSTYEEVQANTEYPVS